MVILIVIGTLGIIPKGLLKGLEEKEIKGEAKVIQITALLSSASILRRVLETWLIVGCLGFMAYQPLQVI